MAKKKANSCPKGTLCLSTETICVFTVLVICALCVYIYYLHQQSTQTNTNDTTSQPSLPNQSNHLHENDEQSLTHSQHTNDTPHQMPSTSQPHHSSSHATHLTQQSSITQQPPNITTNIFQSSNYTDPVLQPPLRMSPSTTRVQLMPINIETRGTTPEMQQVGTLRNKSNDTILALYGRPTYRGSSKWLYYTATDKFHSIKLPVEKNKRDCTSEYGCDELYEDDEVRVKGYGGVFLTSIYQLDAPRYIPYIA